MGTNGSGKSTIVKMLTGLLEPTSGDARILGQSILAESVELKKQIGVLPESLALFESLSVWELAALIGKCQEEKDFELQGFIILAACTGLRKTAILSRKWEEVKLDVDFPSIFLPKKDSKNRRSNRLPLPLFCVEALKRLPSYEKHEYLFPARPNVKHRNVEQFQKPHAWDIGKRFRRIRDLAGIKDLRIHDLLDNIGKVSLRLAKTVCRINQRSENYKN